MAYVHIPSKSSCMIKSKIEPTQVCGHLLQVSVYTLEVGNGLNAGGCIVGAFAEANQR